MIRLGKKKWQQVDGVRNSSTWQFAHGFDSRLKVLDPVQPFIHLPFNHHRLLYMSHIIIMGHQLVTLLNIGMKDAIYDFIQGLQEVVTLTYKLLFKAIDIFWLEVNRKPPDKEDSIAETEPSSPLLLGEVEKPLLHVLNEKKRRFFIQSWKPQLLVSKVLLTLTAQPDMSGFADLLQQFDCDSVRWIIDTGSSENVCNNKSLFVGNIKKCTHISIQGVGGALQAAGYGTVKFRVTDDQGQLHDMVVNNVLYVPSAPANLLSPQSWSKKGKKLEAFELTSGDMTYLVWGSGKFKKSIVHHPMMKLPLLTVNEGFTEEKMIEHSKPLMSQCCRPCYMCPSTYNAATDTIIPSDDIDEDYLTLDDADIDPSAIQEDEDIPTSEGANARMYDTMYGDEQDHSEDMDHDNLPPNAVEALQDAIKSPMTDDQREFLAIHYASKHMPFSILQKMAREGKGGIPRKFAKVDPPLCPACVIGKQHRRPWRARGKRTKHVRKPHENYPGANTSVDQMASSHPGLIPQVTGNLMNAKYQGAQIHVDHATDFLYAHLMLDFSGEATVEAKRAYEKKAATNAVRVQAYHGDNGRFADSEFYADVKDCGQDITFCGVGSHHQNGIAEKKIRDITEHSRTLLAHGRHMWPEAVKTCLWPFALKAAERAHNMYKLDKKGLSPLEKFSRVRHKFTFKNEHPLFCPVYVLDSRLESQGIGVPRWEPRSDVGVYLGHSPEHASSVAMVLNLNTGHVSPKYHVIFDDDFSTVPYLRSKEEPPNWEQLCKTSMENYKEQNNGVMDFAAEFRGNIGLDDMFNTMRIPDNQNTPGLFQVDQPAQSIPAADNDTDVPNRNTSSNPTPESRNNLETSTNPVDTNGPTSNGDSQVQPDVSYMDSASQDDNNNVEDASRLSSSQREPTPTITDMETDNSNDSTVDWINIETAGLRRSERIKNNMKKSIGLIAATMMSFLSSGQEVVQYSYSTFRSQIKFKPKSMNARLRHHFEVVQLNADSTYNHVDPMSFAASVSDNEVYYFEQAMQQDDAEQFLQAMIKEIDDHFARKHWKLVPRSSIGQAKPLKAIWSFKRKRRPDGSLLKHKARLCCHGGMQVFGENYWDTYAPVVNWMSIRSMLIFSLLHDLHARSIDFTLAFPQADVEATIYMDLPRGVETVNGKDEVFLILKNLYGLKQASKTWFEHLRDGLTSKDLGFTPSAVDPCVFYKDGCAILCYVDDCLIFARTKAMADKVLSDLRAYGYVLTDEGEVTNYLGVQVERDPNNGSFTLTQPYLIERILGLLGDAVQEANTKSTPAVPKEILHKDELGPARKQSWNYRSLIGMLSYLANTTRPDIAFATHQCARFAANPRLIHERAAKRICRYLKGTFDSNGKPRGLVMRPDKNTGIECYVDADFAGGYRKDLAHDPVSVLSRTGYVIFYMSCPIIWVSKMQTEITLSTTESEYVALSQSMRDVIPFMALIEEASSLWSTNMEKPKIICKLFEDNNGALELAKAPKYRPRTKHIALKYHHFREHVSNGSVKILSINTEDQIADQFTKALADNTFKHLRKQLMGW